MCIWEVVLQDLWLQWLSNVVNPSCRRGSAFSEEFCLTGFAACSAGPPKFLWIVYGNRVLPLQTRPTGWLVLPETQRKIVVRALQYIQQKDKQTDHLKQTWYLKRPQSLVEVTGKEHMWFYQRNCQLETEKNWGVTSSSLTQGWVLKSFPFTMCKSLLLSTSKPAVCQHPSPKH